ncbi:MAG: PKD domain-containing protein [candidate division WOR-3 bacterium]
MRVLAAVLLLVALAWAAEPPESISVTIPEWTIKEIGGLHYVEIPGGKLLMRDGQPRLPFYPVTINYPPGYYVQDVVLIQKSGRRSDTGIRLPEIQITVDTAETFQPPKAAVTKGWYPDRDFDWQLWDSPQGGTDLVLSLYPLHFNSEPGELVSHSKYQFRVEYVKTGITLTGLTADKTAYEPGARVVLRLQLQNRAEPRNLILTPKVSGPVSLALPASQSRILKGDTTLTLEWQTGTAPAGDYTVTLLISDEQGNRVGQEKVNLRLGIPAAEIVSFAAEPAHFQIGQDVKLALAVRNTGSCPISGTGVFRLFRDGSIVNEWSCPYQNLEPGASATLNTTWRTSQAEKGAIYYLTAFARYDGGATPACQLLLSTNRMPEARFTVTPESIRAGQEVQFDGSGSTDSDGEIVDYRWEFGDGGTGQGVRATHRYQLPGAYEVKLTVTDNEGGTGTATKSVVIAE